jgi:hypothetical protein
MKIHETIFENYQKPEFNYKKVSLAAMGTTSLSKSIS